MTDRSQCERLKAYVWADQRERLERLDAAIGLMQTAPVRVETCDAQQWLAAVLPSASERYITRVVYHSIFWSYLTPVAQEHITAYLTRIAAEASTERPLAWLRLELLGRDQPAALRLTLWPEGVDELLARVHPHGAWVDWGE